MVKKEDVSVVIYVTLNVVLFAAGIIPRLVNGDCDADEEAWYGRLEVSLDGGETWGTVCDDYFDDDAARCANILQFINRST